MYAIYILSEIKDRNATAGNVLSGAIAQIRLAIENHEQNPVIVSDILTNITEHLDETQRRVLQKVATAIKDSSYDQTAHEKWRNPLGRMFESTLQINLLQNPTPQMMAAVAKVSEKIIALLEKHPGLQSHYLRCLGENFHVIAFGSYPDIPSYDDIKRLFTENNPENLAKIMHAHFKFARDIIRGLEGEERQLAIKVGRIADTKIYESAYYRERGRAREFDYDKWRTRSSQMGLVTDSEFEDSLPTHDSNWVPDARAQDPNLESEFTLDLIENDTPYVAGPSGMTALLTGQMLGLEVLEAKEEKQSYFAAITAYMVAGGFHSLHEVLGPVAMCVPEEKLVPNYQVNLPTARKRAAPPNYHAFYSEQERIDPGFSAVHESGWESYQTFFKEKYRHSQNLRSFQSLVGNSVDETLQGISRYQARSKGLFSYFLNPDRSRGVIRANSYKEILQDCETPLEQHVITYAILASHDGPTLKHYVTKALGFETVTDAMQSLSVDIKAKLREKFDSQTLTALQKINEDVLGPIIKAANSKKLYHSSDEHSAFSEPLKLLARIASGQLDEPTQAAITQPPSTM